MKYQDVFGALDTEEADYVELREALNDECDRLYAQALLAAERGEVLLSKRITRRIIELLESLPG
jgi:hypothetical protein